MSHYVRPGSIIDVASQHSALHALCLLSDFRNILLGIPELLCVLFEAFDTITSFPKFTRSSFHFSATAAK